MTAGSPTVVLDYPAGDRVGAMRIGGMSVLERTLREAARAGATRAYARAEAATLPTLPTLAITVVRVAPGAAVPAEATPIPGDVVGGVRVTDRASARAAMRALLASCRRPYDGIGDRYVIRYVSLSLTRVLCHTPVRPNHVTLANIAVGLSACWFASRGTGLGFALAGALIFLLCADAALRLCAPDRCGAPRSRSWMASPTARTRSRSASRIQRARRSRATRATTPAGRSPATTCGSTTRTHCAP